MTVERFPNEHILDEQFQVRGVLDKFPELLAVHAVVDDGRGTTTAHGDIRLAQALNAEPIVVEEHIEPVYVKNCCHTRYLFSGAIPFQS